jgi:hypothetical protein
VRCSRPINDFNLLFETSSTFKFGISWQIEGANSVSRFFEIFRNSSVVGKDHIFSILFPAIESFLRNDSFLNSGTSYLKRFPPRSRSVRFLNFWISERFSAARFTNLNEMSSEGFFTSDKLLIAVVLELKLFELQERLPFFVRIVL